MIVKNQDTRAYICPIMSFRHRLAAAAEPCRGETCMAWRPYKNGLGFCGLSNPARDLGTPDEAKIKNGDMVECEK